MLIIGTRINEFMHGVQKLDIETPVYVYFGDIVSSDDIYIELNGILIVSGSVCTTKNIHLKNDLLAGGFVVAGDEIIIENGGVKVKAEYIDSRAIIDNSDNELPFP